MREARTVDDVLAYTPYVARGRARLKDVALTFDDGPGPSTSALLRYLTAHRVPATFFLVGREISVRPGVVRQEVRDGFSLGTHTETHPMLAARSADAQSAEILDTARRITRLGGGSVRLFRPPYGSFDATTLRVLGAARMLMALWSVDSKDYAARSPAPIVYTVLSGARAGTIILMHDGPIARPNTVAALRTIVPALRRKGYRLVSIPMLLGDDAPPHNQTPPHSLAGG